MKIYFLGIFEEKRLNKLYKYIFELRVNCQISKKAKKSCYYDNITNKLTNNIV